MPNLTRCASRSNNLQADNETLQAKLKEALAAQPAAVDARELARVQEQLRSLMKENDLLKISLAQGKAGTMTVTSGVDPTRSERAQTGSGRGE